MAALARKYPVSLVLALVVAGLILTSGARPACADQLSYNLTISNGGISPTAPSYGTITLMLTGSGDIDAMVTMEPGYKLGHGFGFNVVGSTAGLEVSGLSPGWTFPGTTLHLSTFGNFESGVTSNPSNRYDSLSFTVSRTVGFTTVTQLVDLSTGGSLPATFAVHVFPVGPGRSSGYAAATLTPVPEPATMTLLGLGLAGFGGWTRMRRKKH